MPVRHILQAEALAYLASNPAEPNTSVVTSLPDVSEIPALGLEGWQAWFVNAARRVIAWVPEGGVAVFYQSSIRHEGRIIDKGYLVMQAAEAESAAILWHKIVCRRPPGTIAFGRPTYSHMICVERGLAPRGSAKHPGPDVVADCGFMPWSRAMGVNACRVALRFIQKETSTRLIVDPFCGHGTVLAVANTMGFDAIGVDVGAKQCRAARALVIPDEPRG